MTHCVIYSTPATWAGESISLDIAGCKVNFFRGKREFEISQKQTSFIIQGNSRPQTFSVPQRIQTEPDRNYVAIYARMKNNPTPEIPDYLGAKIRAAKAMSMLTASVSENLFDVKIGEGTIIGKSNAFVISSALKLIKPPSISRRAVQDAITKLSTGKVNDPKFELMSHFYSAAWPLETSEQKFLLLWTILEIFPMTDTTDISPLKKLIRSVAFPALNAADVEEKLHIGRLYGLRCDIAHDGFTEKERHKLSREIGKLLDLTQVVMRHFLGREYNGALDKYPIKD